ncbi:MAG: ArsR family transcriptional regulator [bacterium]|nr:ArsR family transcriptional regulator [bacterium]
MRLNKPTLDKLRIFNDSKILLLSALFKCEDTYCGCDLVNLLKMPKNLLSYHMKYLVEAGYVSEKKCGKKKHYKIKSVKKAEVEAILKMVDAI